MPLVAGAQAAKPATLPRLSGDSRSREVEVARDGQQTAVRVQGNGAGLSYHVSRLTRSRRAWWWISTMRSSGCARNAVPSNYEPVRGVRLGQSRPDQVRVVIDLRHPAEFSVDERRHER